MDGDENEITRLCLAGMRAESKGEPDEARELYTRAWDAAAGDYDACVAAHFLARVQTTPADNLRWNTEALRRAGAAAAAGDGRVAAFYPSLYLNMGHAQESLGARDEARRYYDLAAARLDELPDTPYGEMIRGGIAAGRARVADEAG